MSDDVLEVGVRCGICGGPILMLTCDSFRQTGHEWVICSVCSLCRTVHWVEGGCEEEECRG